ncbi:DUF3368 domain-containing protein [candidate division CSSED10-310 bacterium]|uniref:DUF3368 domain-containing protein n=1 Tax=candidate division CSSED10-310 bacterium TaxID=2855610 RepID=A0ABV6YZL8_UNCC1
MPGASEVREFDWIVSQRVQNRPVVNALDSELDKGESEAIALALEIKADMLLIDERRARQIAIHLGLKVVGILGVLVEAKHKSLIPSLKSVLDNLISKAGFRVSHKLYEKVLEAVDENKDT